MLKLPKLRADFANDTVIVAAQVSDFLICGNLRCLEGGKVLLHGQNEAGQVRSGVNWGVIEVRHHR